MGQCMSDDSPQCRRQAQNLVRESGQPPSSRADRRDRRAAKGFADRGPGKGILPLASTPAEASLEDTRLSRVMERTATPAEGVVAIGASAGGIEALCELAAGMPPDFPFAVMIVIHMGRGAPSLLAQIVARSGPLPAVAAVDGAVLEAGRIYAAVPDHHLLARDHRVALSDGPPESGRRPEIDALLRYVALDYGPRAIGVLMSGMHLNVSAAIPTGSCSGPSPESPAATATRTACARIPLPDRCFPGRRPHAAQRSR